MQFSVALVCHFLLLLCTSAANNNGDANNAQNAHFGSDRTFVDRHSGLSIFAFAALRRARYFSPQAKGFMQFSVALVCHFSLLFCTSAANNNGNANHGENAYFGSCGTFVDRHSCFDIFLRVAFVAGRPKKDRDPDLAAEGFKTILFVNEFLIGRTRPPEPDFWTRLLDRGQKLQFRLGSVRIGDDFC